MNDIVLSTQNGEPVASSREIAKCFGKEHRDVLRAIEDTGLTPEEIRELRCKDNRFQTFNPD